MSTVASWSIADFKSLGSAKMRFPDLTILAGANSSGKSSVLQSMLMTGQSANRGGAIVLNGQLVRLGEPHDVLRDGQQSIQIGLGIDAEIGPGDGASGVNIDVAVSLQPDADLATLVPTTYGLTSHEEEIALEATSVRSSQNDAKYLVDRLGNADLTFLRITHIGDKRAPSRMYLGCLGMAPVVVAVHLSESKARTLLKKALKAIHSPERITYEFYYEVANFVPKKKFFEGQNLTLRSSRSKSQRRNQEFWHPEDFDDFDTQHFDALKADLIEERAKDGWAILEVFNPYSRAAVRRRRDFRRGGLLEEILSEDYGPQLHALAETATAIDRFGSELKYLGPLRDEPKVVHGVWDERVSALPVGSRGELTADVLTREKDTRVRYRNPDWKMRSALLPEAVSDWCRYLGIGEGIEVMDHGKLGRGVTLTVEGKPRDLTMIGVGASQLLPILVAGLVAPNGSLVLVEQPELHLHPSVQSRLADFLLFASPDVRFIVETHSEYLVTRLRRRVAEGRVKPEQLDVQFAERKAGVTQVRTLGMSELGDFEEWPEGFFDEQENDSRHILRAIAKSLSADK